MNTQTQRQPPKFEFVSSIAVDVHWVSKELRKKVRLLMVCVDFRGARLSWKQMGGKATPAGARTVMCAAARTLVKEWCCLPAEQRISSSSSGVCIRSSSPSPFSFSSFWRQMPVSLSTTSGSPASSPLYQRTGGKDATRRVPLLVRCYVSEGAALFLKWAA